MADPSEVAGVLMVPSGGRQWSNPGGHTSEEGITLYFIAEPDGRRYEVFTPITVKDGHATFGSPVVVEL